MNHDNLAIGGRCEASVLRRAKDGDDGVITGRFDVLCYDRNGVLKWEDRVENLVVTTGRNDLLDKYFKGSTYTAAHYMGLVADNPTIIAGDTMASHAGWTEVTDYDESTRPSISWGSPSSGSLTSSGVNFTINTTVTVAGLMITTNSTKGGSTGTLYCAGTFTGGDKSLQDDDVLSVTYQASYTTP